ncbi:hypothetical protein OAN22_01760 [Alphaproteobacteria bacterium]|nr:hypothetical protein [Alphaproteobacteria bacterium]
MKMGFWRYLFLFATLGTTVEAANIETPILRTVGNKIASARTPWYGPGSNVDTAVLPYFFTSPPKNPPIPESLRTAVPLKGAHVTLTPAEKRFCLGFHTPERRGPCPNNAISPYYKQCPSCTLGTFNPVHRASPAVVYAAAYGDGQMLKLSWSYKKVFMQRLIRDGTLGALVLASTENARQAEHLKHVFGLKTGIPGYINWKEVSEAADCSERALLTTQQSMQKLEAFFGLPLLCLYPHAAIMQRSYCQQKTIKGPHISGYFHSLIGRTMWLLTPDGELEKAYLQPGCCLAEINFDSENAPTF